MTVPKYQKNCKAGNSYLTYFVILTEICEFAINWQIEE